MFLEGAAAVESRQSVFHSRPRCRRVWLDFETYSEVELVGPKSVGVWNYTRHFSTTALMVAYRIDDGEYQQVDLTRDPFPADLLELLLDPTVEKWAFNAAFERLVCRHVLRIDTPYKGWRCTMARANFLSFSGSLGDVGAAMGLPQDKRKDTEGKRLIKLFCTPQQLTRKNSYWQRDGKTDPEDWQQFLDYNVQDVVAECEIDTRLERFYVPETEWELYEIDQEINDRGLPVNERFVEQAQIMADMRKIELVERMRDLIAADMGLNEIDKRRLNPNSTPQLTPWLRSHGYPFGDLQKDTVKKVLNLKCMSDLGARILRMRQQASRTSVKKYPAILLRLASDGFLRHAFQFVGAARTWRWSGRGPQPHNLPRTPKVLEADGGNAERLEMCAAIIESGNYDDLKTFMAEPMTALAGSIRSSFQAPEGYELRVCDLSAVESAVIAWLSGCKRLLKVFLDGRDPYRDFATSLYRVSYEAVTSAMRTICKPAVLGCGYQLGGGAMREGKRTGLWGYAENNGVDLTKEEAHSHVSLFREIYSEIPVFWKELEEAAARAVRGIPTMVNGLLRFAMDGPFLKVTLPSGSPRYYYRPRMVQREFEAENDDGTIRKYTRIVMSYMGNDQKTGRWGRIFTSGGKWAENLTQATARDILALGVRRAKEVGFKIIGTVHDEIMTLCRTGNNFLTVELLRLCMISDVEWAKGLPLGASGYAAKLYRKD